MKFLRLLRSIQLKLARQASAAPHIFVVGLSRSGTSLLTSRLAMHPDVATLPGETFFFLKRDLSSIHASHLSIPEFDKSFWSAPSEAALFDSLAAHAIDKKRGAKLFLEKTPDHVFRISKISRLYPNARFIYMVRDPRDAFISWNSHPKLPNFSPHSYVKYWNKCCEQYKKLPEKRAISVRYEDLCTSADEEISRVLQFLLLDAKHLDEDRHEMDRVTKVYQTSGGHEKLLHSIDSKSVCTWGTKLTQGDISTIERGTFQFRKRWGYC